MCTGESPLLGEQDVSVGDVDLDQAQGEQKGPNLP